jgi:hypothetical protein
MYNQPIYLVDENGVTLGSNAWMFSDTEEFYFSFVCKKCSDEFTSKDRSVKYCNDCRDLKAKEYFKIRRK